MASRTPGGQSYAAYVTLGSWFATRRSAEWQQMTITYPNGTVVQALLLARGNDTLRAIVTGDDDVRTFNRLEGTWMSEDLEPVRIEFAWQRRTGRDTPVETECVCSKKLASRLVSTLLAGSEGDDLIEDMLYVFSAEGNRVRIQGTQVRPARQAGEATSETAANALLTN